MTVNVAAAKRTVKSALASSVGWKLFNRTLRRPGVSVLMYHRIRDHDASLGGLPLEVFTAHMEWLRERCDPIWPEELPERVEACDAYIVTDDGGTVGLGRMPVRVIPESEEIDTLLATACPRPKFPRRDHTTAQGVPDGRDDGQPVLRSRVHPDVIGRLVESRAI